MSSRKAVAQAMQLKLMQKANEMKKDIKLRIKKEKG